MSIDSTTQRPAALQQSRPSRPSRPSVPWSTVLPLAVVLAYADGFWMTSLRGSVGAIETTQSPFASWWRQSTLLLPVFVFAVLAALTLALRWFGPVRRKPRTVLATVLLIVAAGTVVGLGEIVASAAYDYHLQVNQLRLMDLMQSMCTGNCLPQQAHDTLAVHIRGTLYVSRWLLLTNLGLVTWLVAMRGGRLKLSTTGTRQRGGSDTGGVTGSRATDIRLLLVSGLLGAGAIHAAVVPEHLGEWSAAGVFFIVLTAAEIAVAAAVLAGQRIVRLAGRQHGVLLAAVVISVVPLLLWFCSRTAGLPFGPEAGIPEAIGLPDCVACALELATLLAAVVLMRAQARSARPPASAHVRALVVVALIAVTAIGLAATELSWFNGFAISGRTSDMPGMSSATGAAQTEIRFDQRHPVGLASSPQSS